MKKIFLALCLLPLAACHVQQDFHEPTIVTSQKLSLHQAAANYQGPTKDVDEAMAEKIAADYRQNGQGPVEITVTYDCTASPRNTGIAAREAKRIAGLLTVLGVPQPAADTIPAAARGAESQTLISYQTESAAAPAACHPMGGVDGPTTIDTSYKLGCTIEQQMAGQIARPQDLAGRGGLDAGSGRRAANVADSYQHGVQQPALQNTQSSTADTSQ